MISNKIKKIVEEILKEDQIEYEEILSIEFEQWKGGYNSGTSGAEIEVIYKNDKKTLSELNEDLDRYKKYFFFTKLIVGKPILNFDKRYTYSIKNLRILNYLLERI